MATHENSAATATHLPASPGKADPQDDSDREEDLFAELHRLEETFYREGHALGQVDGDQLGRVEGRVFGTKRAFDRFFEISRLHGHAVGLGNQLPDVCSPREVGAGDIAGGGSSQLVTAEPSTRPAASTPAHNMDTTTNETALQNLSLQPNSPPTPDIEHTLPLLLSNIHIPPFPGNAPTARLERHIRTLYALSEPASLSTRNTEDDVSEFDDRMKRAHAKATILARMLPGHVSSSSSLLASESGGQREGSVAGGDGGEEDDDGGRLAGGRGGGGEANIEDDGILRARH